MAINDLVRSEKMAHEGMGPKEKHEAFALGLTQALMGMDCPVGVPLDSKPSSLDHSLPYRIGHSRGKALRDAVLATTPLD
jgi:hypothetical protein